MSIFLTLLPTLLQFVGWIFDKYQANEATKKAFLGLIEAAKLDPAISLKMKDDFVAMEEELRKGGGQ